jgi:phage host-nuclease inhibitor protein Gam
MTTMRIKVNLPMIKSREEAESVMTELATAANDQRSITVERDALVLEINDRFENQLAKCAEVLKEKTDALRAWAEANPDVFPKDCKSLKLTSGTLGFRTGMPKLALLSRAFNWDKVLALFRASGWGRAFIRTKDEVDKDSVLAMCRKVKKKERIAACLKRRGLKQVQDETFFIEPDLTAVESRQVQKTI